MIKNKEMVFFNGPMEANTKDSGKMGNKMELENIILHQENTNKANGVMANE